MLSMGSVASGSDDSLGLTSTSYSISDGGLSANYSNEVSSADYTLVELLNESKSPVNSVVRPATH